MLSIIIIIMQFQKKHWNAYYKLVIDDVSDKIVEFSDDDDDLDDLIGGIDD